MGAPNLPLAEIPTADVEVAGFNGRPGVECGFSLPILRHKPTDSFCLLSQGEPHPRWDSAAVIDEYADLGRLTLLASPLNVPDEVMRAVLDGRTEEQPVVAWASNRFLAGIGIETTALNLATAFESLDRPVPNTERFRSRTAVFMDFQCWLSDAEAVASDFDDWANTYTAKFDTTLATEHPNWAVLERIADFGLCAARDPGVRYALFVRYCAAMYLNPDQPPERAMTQYRVLVRNEFKSVTWERFRADMLFVLNLSRDRLEFERGGTSTNEKAAGTGERLAANG